MILLCRLTAQPQAHLLRLQSLFHHRQQLLSQLLQLYFVTRPGSESLQRLLGVVFMAVEAPVDVILDAPAEGREQRCNEQCGSNYNQGAGLAGERAKNGLKDYDSEKIDYHQRPGQCAIDQRAADDDVDIP